MQQAQESRESADALKQEILVLERKLEQSEESTTLAQEGAQAENESKIQDLTSLLQSTQKELQQKEVTLKEVQQQVEEGEARVTAALEEKTLAEELVTKLNSEIVAANEKVSLIPSIFFGW